MASNSDFQLQNSNQAIEYARETIRSAATLNGGAAIAVVGFIGSKDVVPSPLLVQDSLWWFCAGLILAFCASAIGYISQTLFAAGNAAQEKGLGDITLLPIVASVLGMIFVFCSTLSFLRGVYVVSGAIFGSPTP